MPTIKARLNYRRAWPFGWNWYFTGGPDRGRWSSAGWALTASGAQERALDYLHFVEEQSGVSLVSLREI